VQGSVNVASHRQFYFFRLALGGQEIPSIVGSYSSTKWLWMSWMVRQDLPTPPPPTTTSLYSLKNCAKQEMHVSHFSCPVMVPLFRACKRYHTFDAMVPVICSRRAESCSSSTLQIKCILRRGYGIGRKFFSAVKTTEKAGGEGEEAGDSVAQMRAIRCRL